jgi:hypothetical protein
MKFSEIQKPVEGLFYLDLELFIFAVLPIRYVYPGSASKNLSVLTQKMVLSSGKYDPGCSSRIRILIFYPSWL